jgi:hypothetical protein
MRTFQTWLQPPIQRMHRPGVAHRSRIPTTGSAQKTTPDGEAGPRPRPLAEKTAPSIPRVWGRHLGNVGSSRPGWSPPQAVGPQDWPPPRGTGSGQIPRCNRHGLSWLAGSSRPHRASPRQGRSQLRSRHQARRDLQGPGLTPVAAVPASGQGRGRRWSLFSCLCVRADSGPGWRLPSAGGHRRRPGQGRSWPGDRCGRRPGRRAPRAAAVRG